MVDTICLDLCCLAYFHMHNISWHTRVPPSRLHLFGTSLSLFSLLFPLRHSHYHWSGFPLRGRTHMQSSTSFQSPFHGDNCSGVPVIAVLLCFPGIEIMSIYKYGSMVSHVFPSLLMSLEAHFRCIHSHRVYV